MSKKPNHTCRICGVQYYACSKCDKLKNWRAFCDTPEHYQVFQILLMYARGMIDAGEAAMQLSTLGVQKNSLNGFTPQKVEEIYGIFDAAASANADIDNDDKNSSEPVTKENKKKTRSSDA